MIEILEILLAPFRPKDARSFVSVEGLKLVCCENCSTQYFYEHSVIGSSPASSWYFNPPTPTQVQERDKLALKNGNETFHRKTVPVVCPECDRLQQCMLLDLQQLTARKWNNPLYICLGLAILVGLFGSIGMINAKLNPQNVRHSEALEFCLAVMCIASILLLVAVGLYCVRSYISNADSSSIFFRKAIRMHRYKALSVRQAIIHYLTLHVSSLPFAES